MKKLFIIIGFIAIAKFVSGQQLPLYSQYMQNAFLMNPAIAGSEKHAPLRTTVRSQWVGFDEGTTTPSTQSISCHAPLKGMNMGLGGYLFNDRFGALNRSGLNISYAYHLDLYKIDSKLGFGISGSIYQHTVDKSKLTMLDPDDAILTGEIQKNIVPDANFGMYLYNKKYFVGISGNQLLEYNLDIGNESNKMVRHYYMMAGYKFRIVDDFDLEPSVLAKTTERTPVQFDINLKAYYKNNYWIGWSYRHNEGVITMVGLNYERFVFGYSFDYSLHRLMDYSYGSHEIIVGYDLTKYEEGSTLL